VATSVTLAPAEDRSRSQRSEAVARPRPLAFVVALLVVAVTAGALIVPKLISPRRAYDPSAPATAAFEDETGLRLLRVASTGAVGLVEVQYQIVDPAKAGDFIGHDTYPMVLDEDTGRELTSPWMGHAAHPFFRQGADFYVILEDTGHIVATGGSVTVIVGDTRLEHVPVE
jgi:hypothetical protein